VKICALSPVPQMPALPQSRRRPMNSDAAAKRKNSRERRGLRVIARMSKASLTAGTTAAVHSRVAGAGQWQTEVVRSLASLPDETLDALTTESSIFARTGWLRMLEQVDLSDLTGGIVDLQFAVVNGAGAPAAVCPVLRARGDGLLALYSVRRYYFEYLFEQAANSKLGESKLLGMFARLAARARRLLESAGCSLDDYLIVCNPLSFRGSVSIAPLAGPQREEVARQLVADLQRLAEDQGRPLCFLFVESNDQPVTQMLLEAGFRQVFLFYDNRIRLTEFKSFDDYLQSFPARDRKTIKSELRRTAAAGIAFRRVAEFTELGGDFTRLYEQMYLKHSESIFRHPPEFWRTLKTCLGENVETVLAERDGALAGFVATLNCDRRRELWTYRGGRQYSPELEGVPFYFPLGFYEPIRRAIELRYDNIWLGPAAYDAKLHRGAEQVPLYSYFWFPKQRDRYLTGRYLRRVGNIVRRQIAGSVTVPLRIAPQA
jgi:predicted N-acyltransferase